MIDEHKSSSQETESTFTIKGPLPGGGLIYRISPTITSKNSFKNAYNTDIARDRGIVRETESFDEDPK